MRPITIFFLIALTVTISFQPQGFAQDNPEFARAVRLQEDGRWEEAFPVIKGLLKADSTNPEFLWRTSFLYSQLGVKQNTETNRQIWYKKALYLAKKSVSSAPKSANCHYAYALALGRINENASSKTKIDNAKLIKTEAETAIRYDPKIPGPYHIMGRWHRIVAGFNSFERAMISAIFGSLPGGTYEEAIRNFEKAISLEPHAGIHYYELAITLQERDEKGDREKAIQWLNKALQQPIRTETDREHRSLCNNLLHDLKS
jgi:tetratricopeptide (TPR) repeat protein